MKLTVLATSLLRMPQEVADGPVCCPRSRSPRYLVRRTEVDALVDADVHDIVSHVRKTVISFGYVAAEHHESRSVPDQQLQRVS
jgi:hypothetical protein